MSIKVYFVYDGEPAQGELVSTRQEREAYKAKITIPGKWVEGPCSQLHSFFLKTYNAKFPEKVLAAEDVYLKVGQMILPMQDVVSQHVQEYNDIVVLHHVKTAAQSRPEGSLCCTNFGCGKYFVPTDNAEGSCHHHAKGPVFHDTYKFWACCPEKKAMDWEEFENIPSCVTGTHSTQNAPITFKQEAVGAVALTDAQRTALEQGASTAVMYEGNAKTGPREFEGAKHGQETAQQVVDGKATCRNFGCQQTFVVADNHAEACTYHCEGPVFWDTYKYWKCCPQRKHAEFDDFVKVPGCTTGPHKL
ncbi:zinc-binding protein, putative [Bodo saltans]|uniref:Zinc-binding protein, putative n=1 Tax=Bodo saltans TaxID=75058 RepID=A0A0S4J9B3_BODSA|nr:zinc-binding protein, putative [Bodo saltans]|eukprot:CUG86824.1 zinc-binding protein, putative [Bodo saltans]